MALTLSFSKIWNILQIISPYVSSVLEINPELCACYADTGQNLQLTWSLEVWSSLNLMARHGYPEETSWIGLALL